MGKNEDLLVSGFGVEYGIDIVVFAGDDDGESAIGVWLRNPNTKRDWGDAFCCEELRHKEREVHLRVHANIKIASFECSSLRVYSTLWFWISGFLFLFLCYGVFLFFLIAIVNF